MIYRLALAFLFSAALFTQAHAQKNTSPQAQYQWKTKRQTVYQDGYVILRSGKRLNGQIALSGFYDDVEEVDFNGDGKEITFPVGALQEYGLLLKAQPTRTGKVMQGGIISESDESLYEWRDGGIIMDKVVTNSVPRAGYVVTKKGEKVEGELKIQKRDANFWTFVVKNESGKQKFKAAAVARYGLTVSAEEINQANLAKVSMKMYPGTVRGNAVQSGKIGLNKDFFRIKSILVETRDGKRKTIEPTESTGFTIEVDNEQLTYYSRDDHFVLAEYDGELLQLYRNPRPTTYNQLASSAARVGTSIGTNLVAQEIAKADARKNDYVTNLDSIIGVASKEELIELRDGLLQLHGFESYEQMEERSNNESLKNNISALELAITGKEVAAAQGGIYNKEFIIFNKKTGEKTVVYKSDYKKQISSLLFGCYDYLSLDERAQKEYTKWSNMEQSLKYLDGCYE